MADVFKPCSIEGCKRNAHYKAGGGRGWCDRHRKRVLRFGDPLIGGTSQGEALEWLRDRKDYRGEQCLIWPYAIYKAKGYGAVFYKGRMHHSSRVMCIFAHGEPPQPDYDAAHSCGNRMCVNPAHIRWATRIENEIDKIAHDTLTKGSRNGSVKLRAEEVLQIRKLGEACSQQTIADRFNVSRTLVHKILSGKLWAWL